MNSLEHIKDWVDKQIEEIETQFIAHKEGLGVTELGAGYVELGEASSEHLHNTDVNPVEVFIDGFYYGTLNGEYLKLCEMRGRINGIDFNLED